MPQQPDGSSASHLVQLRRARGLSQEELAERSGVSARSIRNLERGQIARPRRATLEALGAAFGLDDKDTDRFVARMRGVAPTAVHTPAQLPAADSGFTGRTTELAELSAALLADDVPGGMAIIEGNGGLGKTQLALKWAYDARASFPDGQLFARLHGFGSRPPVDASAVLSQFLTALGTPEAALPGNLDARAALFRTLVARRQLLIVLDDAADYDQLAPLLPGSPTCSTLITTRRRMVDAATRHGCRRLKLGPLPSADASRLLDLAGAATPAERERALHACAGFPLALRILSAQAQDLGWSYALDRVATLDGLSTTQGDVGVRQVVAGSVERLDPAAREMFELTGLAGTPDIPWHVLAAMSGLTVAAAKSAVDELVAIHLVTPREDGLLVHDLVQQYAAELAAGWSDERKDAALTRFTALVIDVADDARRAAHRRAGKSTDDPRVGDQAVELPDDTVSWLPAHHEQVRFVIDWVCSRRPDALTLRLADSLWVHFQRFMWESEAPRLYAAATEIAQRSGDPATMSQALEYRGTLESRAGNWLEARTLLDEALRLAEAADDLERRATVTLNLGELDFRLGNHEASARQLQHAADLYRLAGHPMRDDHVLATLAGLQAAAGRHDQADELMRRCLKLKTEDPTSYAWTLGDLAENELLRGNPRTATRLLRRAIPEIRRGGDRERLVDLLVIDAAAHVALGELRSAAECLTEAQDMMPQMPTLRLRNALDNTRAELSIARGRIEIGRELYRAVACRARHGHDRDELNRAIRGLRALDASGRGAADRPSDTT